MQKRVFIILILFSEICNGIMTRNIFFHAVVSYFLFEIKTIILYNEGSKPNFTGSQLILCINQLYLLYRNR